MKKLTIKLLTAILVLNLLINSAYAISSDELVRRNKVMKFVSSTIDLQRFKQNWQDYFRGYCQRREVFRLRDLLSQLRRDIIDSVAAELNGNIDEMINDYYKADTQLFFVRNFAETSYDFNPLDDPEFDSKIDRTELEKQMLDYFVIEKNYLDSDELYEYIDQFYARYDKDSFLQCPNPSIQGIGQKIASIKDKIENLSIDNLKEDMELDEPIIYEASTVKDSPGTMGDTLLKGRLGIRLNGVSPSKKAEELYNQIIDEVIEGLDPDNAYDQELLAKYEQLIAERTGDKSPEEIAIQVFSDKVSLQRIFQSKEADNRRNELELVSAERLAKYDVVFGQTEDALSLRIISLIQELNSTVKNTTPIISEVGQCFDDAYKRQCSE